MEPGWEPSGQLRYSKVMVEDAEALQTRATPFWPLTPGRLISLGLG